VMTISSRRSAHRNISTRQSRRYLLSRV